MNQIALTIAGFDPSAGAGILSDIKTMEHIGVYGMAVLTCNTIQTDDRYYSSYWVPVDQLLEQLSCLFDKYPIQHVKIGMIRNNKELLAIVQEIKKRQPAAFICWDPILKSSSGRIFFDDETLDQELVNFIDLITPNQLEFDFFSIEKMPFQAILLKGGHRDEKGTDLLYYQNEVIRLEGERLNEFSKHGTGCVLSSAILAYRMQGNSLLTACQKGKAYVENFLISNSSNLGTHEYSK